MDPPGVYFAGDCIRFASFKMVQELVLALTVRTVFRAEVVTSARRWLMVIFIATSSKKAPREK